ncbi:MAG: hypothetical protein AAGA28_00670 [Pseudomonadota bacterium]
MSEKPGASDGGKPEREKIKAEDIRLSCVIKNMTFGEWSALISVIVVITGGAAAIGGFLEKLNRDSLIASAVSNATKPIEDERTSIAEKLVALTSEFDAANANLRSEQSEKAQLERANSAMENEVRTLLANLELEQSFTTFAENYINYLVGGSDVAADILSDYVCALYRDSQVAGKSINFQTNSIEDIVNGNTDLSLNELEESGYNAELVRELREMRRSGIVRVLPNVSKALGREVSPNILKSPIQALANPNVKKQNKAQIDQIFRSAVRRVDQERGVLVKVVTFPGHSPFRLPEEIAARVHKNPSCRVN